MIPIDKGIPVAKDTRGKPRKYPMEDLEVGDSFFAEGRKSGDIGPVLARARKSTGRKFTSRTVTENGVIGTRVWRIE